MFTAYTDARCPPHFAQKLFCILQTEIAHSQNTDYFSELKTSFSAVIHTMQNGELVPPLLLLI